MRTFVYGLLLGLIVSLVGYIYWESTKDEPGQDPVIEYVENIHKLDSLQYQINLLTAKIDSSKSAIQKKNTIIVAQKKDLTKVRSYADSLEAVYMGDRTLERCDSIIMAKNEVIVKQDTVIQNQEFIIDECTNQVVWLNEKVYSQDQIIFQKDSTIETLSCAYDWKIRRKFLAWLLGWKCNK